MVEVDKPLSMLCEQRGTRLTKDKMKPDTRYPVGLIVSRFQIPRKATSDALYTEQ